jgi:hypothetical protein
MIIVVQTGAVIFSALAILRTFVLYRRNQITLSQAVLWLSLWLVIAVVAVYPELTQRVANAVGIVRGVDLMLYVGMVVLYYFIYRMVIRLEHIERDITSIVRKIALDNSSEHD